MPILVLSFFLEKQQKLDLHVSKSDLGCMLFKGKKLKERGGLSDRQICRLHILGDVV